MNWRVWAVFREQPTFEFSDFFLKRFCVGFQLARLWQEREDEVIRVSDCFVLHNSL